MYKSPIQLIQGPVLSEITHSMDAEIFQAVQQIGVDVDKAELLKALQYDRNQYRMGYQDGYNAAIQALAKAPSDLSSPVED